MKREKTFTITYNYFEPGTYVVPTSNRSVLAHEDGPLLFKVTECLEPQCAEDTCVVFVEWHRTGVDATYLREATPEELKKGDRIDPLANCDGFGGSTC